jgi:hypothetical protein
MAKKRNTPIENPLLRNRVSSIVGEVEQGRDQEIQAQPQAVSKKQPSKSTKGSTRKGREYLHVKTRFAKEEAEAMERFTRTLSAYMQTKLWGSEVTRALWTIAIRAEERLAEVSHNAPNLERPSNGDRMAYAEFEDAITEFLAKVLR